jgi:hypothetical protein
MSLTLFPIGNTASKVSSGTLDSISYNMFEPNLHCHSNIVYNILTTMFQDQTTLTRQKAAPYLIITYEYENILDREYRQLEHFVDNVDDSMTSFYAIDWSKAQNPSVVASVTNKWRITLDNTKLYSDVANYKSNKILLWNGSKWKLGDIAKVNTNATIALDMTYHRGSLKYTEADAALAYPVYEARFAQGALSGFKSGEYIDDRNMTLTGNGGYMRSGIINFISRYKVK